MTLPRGRNVIGDCGGINRMRQIAIPFGFLSAGSRYSGRCGLQIGLGHWLMEQRGISRRMGLCRLLSLLPLSMASRVQAASGGGDVGALRRVQTIPLHVLLLANSTYRSNAALRNPERDAALLERAFEARGASVHKLTNLASNELENAIPAFLSSLSQPPYALWISYSGHAVQLNGRNFLLGIDSDFSSASRIRGFGVDLDRVIGLVERAKPVAAVISVDACRNNPFEPEVTRGAVSGLAATDPRGLCVSFSTAPYMRALDGEAGQNSPYASALANALAGKQNKSLDAILRETANAVYRNTNQRQVPEYRSSLRGEWWFDAGGGVAVRDAEWPVGTVAAGSAGGGRGSLTREVSYRPDEPALPPRYVNADAAYWGSLNHQLMTSVQRTSVAQAHEFIARAERGKASDSERLISAVFLQDGVQGMAAQPRKARVLLQPLANGGNALAQTLLGESYFEERTFDQAYKWLSIAARSGFSRAVTDLSQMDALGMGGGDPQAG